MAQTTPPVKEPTSIGRTCDQFRGDSDTEYHQERVRACLEETMRFANERLNPEMRSYLKDKYGFTDETIDTFPLGYIPDGDALISHLVNEGFSKTTISKTEIATPGEFKHLFESSGIDPQNDHLLDDDLDEEEYDHYVADYSRGVPEFVDEIVLALISGALEPDEIDLYAVEEQLQEEGEELTLYYWWDNRIFFPYYNEDGEMCYYAGRAVSDTADQIYNNGIEHRDAGGASVTTLAETNLGRHLKNRLEDDAAAWNQASRLVYLGYNTDVYNSPTNEPTARDEIQDIISQDTLPDQAELLSHGLLDPDQLDGFDLNDNICPVFIIPGDAVPFHPDNRPYISPVALGTSVKTEVQFYNLTGHDIYLERFHRPSGPAYQRQITSSVTNDPIETRENQGDSTTLEIPENACRIEDISVSVPDGPVGMQLMTATGEFNVPLRVGITGNPEHFKETIETPIHDWLEDAPEFEIERPKYLKPQTNRPWVSDQIEDALLGIHTVSEGSIIMTEGIPDAVAAIQEEFPTVAPGTTHCTPQQLKMLKRSGVDEVYCLWDNDANDAGIRAALCNARLMQQLEVDIDVYVVDLPRPSSYSDVDLAEFLKETDRDTLMTLIESADKPQAHPKWPKYKDYVNSEVGTDDSSTNQNDNQGQYRHQAPEDEVETSTTDNYDGPTNPLYSLGIQDVTILDLETKSARSTSGRVYRGGVPETPGTESDDHLVIRRLQDGGYSAKTYMMNKTLSPVEYLSVVASCDCNEDRCSCTYDSRADLERSETKPSDVFWAFHYAKTHDHVPLPENAPIPVKAVWYIAEKEDVLPSQFIPDDYDDYMPDTKYNECLDIIEDKYGIDPGRSKK